MCVNISNNRQRETIMYNNIEYDSSQKEKIQKNVCRLTLGNIINKSFLWIKVGFSVLNESKSWDHFMLICCIESESFPTLCEYLFMLHFTFRQCLFAFLFRFLFLIFVYFVWYVCMFIHIIAVGVEKLLLKALLTRKYISGRSHKINGSVCFYIRTYGCS